MNVIHKMGITALIAMPAGALANFTGHFMLGMAIFFCGWWLGKYGA